MRLKSGITKANEVKFLIAAAAVVAALPLAAQAGGNGKGPRASVSVDTVCSLNKNNATFNVELRVRDKSSGTASASVNAYDITALAKVATGNWENQKALTPSISASGLVLPVPPGGVLQIPVLFSLCKDKAIDPDVAQAKGLNAAAKTTYNDGTVFNMCSDDPNTLDVVEPSGIKLTANDINDIDNACKAMP